jgi:hypothetical protein
MEIEGEQDGVYVPFLDRGDKLICREAPFRHDEIANRTKPGEQGSLPVGVTETNCKAQRR